jgi:hypothetical protein
MVSIAENMNSQTKDILLKILSSYKFNLTDEKDTQREILKVLMENQINFHREYRLDSKNILDFFADGIGVEVKIKGRARSIYKQCERYCQFEEVKGLILITNKTIGFPKEINQKPCWILNLGKAWL